MRPLKFVSWALMAGLLAFAAATYAGLPDAVPVHLDAGGNADRFEAKSPLSWFTLSGIALLTFGLMEGIAAVLPRKPQLFNFPDKNRFLALPPEFQAPVIEEMRAVIQVSNIGVLLTLWVVQVLLWRVAMGTEAGALAWLPFLGFLVTPVVLALVSRVTDATEREEKRWKALSRT